MKKLLIAVTIADVFIWIGLLIGISFLEAPLKFQAPGVTTVIGVGIGNLVFHALNKIEVILFFILLVCRYFLSVNRIGIGLIGLIGLVLGLQLVWLMPSLDSRIILLQNGIRPPQSSLHIFYIIGEIIKVILLLIAGIIMMYKNEANDTLQITHLKNA